MSIELEDLGKLYALADKYKVDHHLVLSYVIFEATVSALINVMPDELIFEINDIMSGSDYTLTEEQKEHYRERFKLLRKALEEE